MTKIPVWVVTGGPCSGKTTIIERAQNDQRLAGSVFVGEVAADVITRYRLDENNFEAMWDPVFVKEFQRLVAAECVVRLTVALRKAGKDGFARIILDRYTLDGGAYVPGGVTELITIVGMELDRMLQGVHGVLYLRPPPEQFYVRTQYRKETYAQALELGDGVRNAWADYYPRGVHEIDGSNMEEKYEAFVACILAGEAARHLR